MLVLAMGASIGAQQVGTDVETSAVCGTRKIQANEFFAGYECPQGNGNCVTNESIHFTAGTFPYEMTGCETIRWNFGDLKTSTGPDVLHRYNKLGTFNVTATVSNSYGSAKATFAIDIIGEGQAPPTVEMKWVPTNPLVNTDVTFSVATKDGSEITDWVWDLGDGSTDTGQVVHHVYTKAKTYNVRVTGDTPFGLTRDSGKVTVSDLCVGPEIDIQPQSVSVNPGAPAELAVKASGPGTLKYQWFVGESGDITNPIPGATDPKYFVPVVTSGNTYWVRVTNSCGMIDSDSVTISLNGPCVVPIITAQTMGAFMESNRSTWLHVRAEGTEPLKYQWWRGNQVIPSGVEPDLNTGRMRESAAYTVHVTGPCGTVTSLPIGVRVGPARRPTVDRPE